MQFVYILDTSPSPILRMNVLNHVRDENACYLMLAFADGSVVICAIMEYDCVENISTIQTMNEILYGKFMLVKSVSTLESTPPPPFLYISVRSPFYQT